MRSTQEQALRAYRRGRRAARIKASRVPMNDPDFALLASQPGNSVSMFSREWLRGYDHVLVEEMMIAEQS